MSWGRASELPEVKIKKDLRTAHFDITSDLEAEMDRREKDRLLYVAFTRARDHLVVSAHHKLDRTGNASDSHGHDVHTFASGAGTDLVRRLAVTEQQSIFDPDEQGARSVTGDRHRDDPETWARRREAVLTSASRPRVVSATALAREIRGEITDTDAEPWRESDDAPDALPPHLFRRGRAGTAIGSAVHAVLQLVDLSGVEAVDLDRLVDAQAWAESVPELSATIRRSVDSALRAPIVQACRGRPHWKELFVAAPVGDLTVEGYVDLLVDTDDGLVVVDYKTDAVSSEADIEDKLDGYAMQGAAYAVAVETAVGRPVVDVQFVFARPEGPVVHSVPDLEALRTRLSARAQTS